MDRSSHCQRWKHPESYVLIHAVDGDAYGYGGRTQNARWAKAHPD